MKLTNYAKKLKQSVFGKAMTDKPKETISAKLSLPTLPTLKIISTSKTMNNTMNNTDTIAQTEIPANVDENILKEILKGKTVRYLNEKESTVVSGKERTFKIEHVENIFNAKKSGERCATVYAIDVDDNARDKFRTLHIGGIQVIA